MSHNRDQIIQVLRPFRTIYFEPLGGNHGDKLIEMAARKLLSRSGKIVTTTKSSADAVVINGGGGMTDMWSALSVLFRHIEDGTKPIVVLPSSFYLKEQTLNVLRNLLEKTRCSIDIFARERASFFRLQDVVGSRVNLHLDHDLAFSLAVDDIGRHAQPKSSAPRYALIVERRDAESTTGVPYARAINVPLKQHCPMWLKRPLKRTLQSRSSSQTQFVSLCKSILDRNNNYPGAYKVLDISDTSLCSFSHFVSAVINAEYVFTTRLHVSILRHISKGRCYLVATGGAYRKNESVFEYSMADAGIVELLYLS